MNKFLSKLTWQRVPASVIPIKNLKRETTLSFGYSLVYILIAIGIGIAVKNYPMPILQAHGFIQDFWYAMVFKLLFLLLIPLGVFFLLWNYTLDDLLLGLRFKPSMMIKGSLLVLLGFFLNTKHLAPISEQIPLFQDASLRLLIGILLPLFIAGIPEELFFRGILQTRLEKLLNAPIAIIITGILFTAWHIPSRFFLASGVDGNAGDLNSVLVGTGIPVFVVGTFFGWHWSRYRNLPLLILVHWAIDILPSISSFFQISF